MMKSNSRILMFLIMNTIVFIKFAVGNPNEKSECLKQMKHFCGNKDEPSVDDCAKGAVLRFMLGLPNVLEYVNQYFINEIFVNMTAPELQTVNEFCSDRVKKQLGSHNNEGTSYGEEKKFEEKSDFEETPLLGREENNYNEEDLNEGTLLSLLLIEEKLELDDEEQKKLMLKSKCLVDLRDYAAFDQNYVVHFAVHKVNLDVYENSNFPNYQNNETAKDYLIHVSEKVKVSKYDAQKPAKYCSSLDKKKISFPKLCYN